MSEMTPMAPSNSSVHSSSSRSESLIDAKAEPDRWALLGSSHSDRNLSEIIDELIQEGEFLVDTVGGENSASRNDSQPNESEETEEATESRFPDGLLLPPGTQVGKYVILRQLSRGGQGRVYLAHDPDLDREVAIKVAHRPVKDSTSAVSRLRREGLLIARIHHPRLAQVYDCGVHAGYPFLVMEHVKGQTLREFVGNRRLDSSRIRRIVMDIAEALDAAHRMRILHLDLKPDNVLVADDGRCRLIDFGMAWLLSSPVSRHDRMIGGTWEYMSPEQRSGRIQEWTPATDIFGLGGILCYLLIGRPVLTTTIANDVECRSELDETMMHIRRSVAAADLRRLCLQSIAYEQAERIQDAGTVLHRLQKTNKARTRGLTAIVLGIVMSLVGGIRLGRDWSQGSGELTGLMVACADVSRPLMSKSLVELEITTRTTDSPLVYVWSQKSGVRKVRGLVHEKGIPTGIWRHPPNHPLDVTELAPLVAIIALPDSANGPEVLPRLESAFAKFQATVAFPTPPLTLDLGPDGLLIPADSQPLPEVARASLMRLWEQLHEISAQTHVRILSATRGRDSLISGVWKIELAE